MKTPSTVICAERAVKLKMQAIDLLIERMIAPISDIGNPEKLIGKKYEEWLPEDLQRLATIYGTVEPNPLSDLIFRKKYKEVQTLESAEV